MAGRTTRFATIVASGTAAAALAVGSAGWSPWALLQAQEPTTTFRSGVDLIAVDVQVVDDDGHPIPLLTPEDFLVEISGEPRRVVSADYVQTTQIDGTPFPSSAGPEAVATNIFTEDIEMPSGRIYVMAFDIASLSVAESRTMVGSALNFIDRLLPGDQVGLYTFPIGTWVDPTKGRTAVRQAVAQVVGTSERYASRFNLSFSEIVDINSEASGIASRTLGGFGRGFGGGFDDRGEPAPFFGTTLAAVQQRECGGSPSAQRCVEEIIYEAQDLAFYLEGRGLEELNGLRGLVSALGQLPGRKTVVMFSSGIPTADSAGARPSLGDLPRAVGQDAAATNTTIYTLHVDTSGFSSVSAESRRPSGSPITASRDRAVSRRVLEEFSGASGGTVMPVITGAGEYALDRVLRETSSHYLLGVEPDEDDRDGRVRSLKIEVQVDDVTVRGRSWVVVPERTSS